MDSRGRHGRMQWQARWSLHVHRLWQWSRWESCHRLLWKRRVARENAVCGKNALLRGRSLAGLFQGGRKCLHTGKSSLWFFGERHAHHFLYGRWKFWNLLAQGWRWHKQMLAVDLSEGAMEGPISAYPLVHYNGQCILSTLTATRVSRCTCWAR